MPRFFVDTSLAIGAELSLPRDAAHHALRVLRMADGDAVVLFNGQGGEFAGRLQITGKDQALVRLSRHDPREAELPVAITVGQGLCAADKMDWLIEKSVELGAAWLSPLALQKSVVKLSPDRAEKRAAHWRQLVIAASQQCGRNRLMHVEPCATLSSWLAAGKDQHRLVLVPGAEMTLSGFAKTTVPSATRLLIGPEGGLSANEIEAALAAGYLAIGLGARILRTETAAMVALATLAAHWGTSM